MRIPLVDLTRQYRRISRDVEPKLKAALNKGMYILGENVLKFEEEAARYCGTKYAVGVASGTDALELSVRALGIGKGDEVITSPFTFIATTEAILACGAKPVFVDIEADTYNIDPSLIEDKITKKTKAIMPVHLFGHPSDMGAVLKIAKRHNLKVIEDCAQAMGAEFNGKRVGGFGNVGCLSFFPTKNLGGCGDGGMVVTNDKKTAERIKILRDHGQTTKYRHEFEGTNSRLDEVQAVILRAKIKHLEEWNGLRRKNAAIYRELFNKFDCTASLSMPVERGYARHVYNIYNIRIRERKGLKDFLASQGISTAVYYPSPLHLQKVYRSLGYGKGDFPNSEKSCREALALPVFPELKEKEIGFVVEKILTFLRRKR